MYGHKKHDEVHFVSYEYSKQWMYSIRLSVDSFEASHVAALLLQPPQSRLFAVEGKGGGIAAWRAYYFFLRQQHVQFDSSICLVVVSANLCICLRCCCFSHFHLLYLVRYCQERLFSCVVRCCILVFDSCKQYYCCSIGDHSTGI